MRLASAMRTEACDSVILVACSGISDWRQFGSFSQTHINSSTFQVNRCFEFNSLRKGLQVKGPLPKIDSKINCSVHHSHDVVTQKAQTASLPTGLRNWDLRVLVDTKKSTLQPECFNLATMAKFVHTLAQYYAIRAVVPLLLCCKNSLYGVLK